MIFSEITQNISDFFVSLKDKIIQLYEENKKLSLIVGLLIILILVCLILLICMLPGSKKTKKSSSQPPLVLTETLQIPQGPEMPENYNISRKTETSWSDEEAEPWFTIPSEKEINSLSQSNTKLINDLLGATP